MPFNPAHPNKFDVDLIPFKVRNRYFAEYLGLTPLSSMMGTSADDAIQVFEMDNGEGMSYRVSFRKEIDYETPVVGFNQAAGAEQQIQVYEDEIKLQLLRFVDTLRGTVLVKQMTPIKVYEALQPLLANAQRRNLVKTILDAGTVNLYNKANGGNGPKTDRVVYAGADYNASIYTACAAMNGATYDANGLSVAHLRKLKSMAITGGHTFEIESRIRPVTLKSKGGFPEETYIYLMDTDSFLSLVRDPEWSQFAYRGVIQSADQPENISGARYRGTVEGVRVYECPELARYRVAAGGAKVAAWNLFLGAQAFGLCWSKRPWFAMEKRDFDLNAAMAACEIRGQKALMFASFQNPNEDIERGIIHSFTQIRN